MADQARVVWVRQDLDDPDAGDLTCMFGVPSQGGTDGERLVAELLGAGHQTDEDSFALLPGDLCCVQERSGTDVTVRLATSTEHLSRFAEDHRLNPDVRAAARRFLVSAVDPVDLLVGTFVLPAPDAPLWPGAVVIDSNDAERPADFMAAVRNGDSAYFVIGWAEDDQAGR